jgi:hypothetical protein
MRAGGRRLLDFVGRTGVALDHDRQFERCQIRSGQSGGAPIRCQGETLARVGRDQQSAEGAVDDDFFTFGNQAQRIAQAENQRDSQRSGHDGSVTDGSAARKRKPGHELAPQPSHEGCVKVV